MSKLYEALQKELAPPQPGGNRRGSTMPHLAMGSRQSMEALYQSLENALPGIARKAVLFSASRAGEGTTTIVREFALALSLVFKASVLLVDANSNHGTARACGDAEALPLPDLLRGLQASNVKHTKQPGVTVTFFDPEVANGPAGQANGGSSLGDALREQRHEHESAADGPAGAAEGKL